MKAVIYMRMGNPDQVAVQHWKEKLPGQIQGAVGDSSKRDGLSFYRNSGDMTDTTT